jgi:hypothetical protein
VKNRVHLFLHLFYGTHSLTMYLVWGQSRMRRGDTVLDFLDHAATKNCSHLYLAPTWLSSKHYKNYDCPLSSILVHPTKHTLSYSWTSRLLVRCDGLQQYSCKLCTKKIQDFLLILSALCIIFFDLANWCYCLLHPICFVIARSMKWAIIIEFTTTDWTNIDYKMT